MKGTSVSLPRIKNIISRMRGISVMVAGDVMLDEYWWGSVNRISPEAPVPVVEVNSVTVKLGGAANVAGNILALGARSHLVSVAGRDRDGTRMRSLIEKSGMRPSGLVFSKGRHTTLKTRIVAQHQQVVRADHESTGPLNPRETAAALKAVDRVIGSVSAVILSDYGKGVLSGAFLPAVIERCLKRKIFVAVDPKKRFFKEYAGVSLITPNLKEAWQALGVPPVPYSEKSVRALGWELVDKHQLPLLLITLGEHGMALFESHGRRFSHLETAAQKVYDVTGAGDTVISAFTAAMAAGASPFEAAFLANHAAGITVGELGTATVSAQALLNACSWK
jgi:D-glycero-beta-D-manno-heptose-7-phosphate kinase